MTWLLSVTRLRAAAAAAAADDDDALERCVRPTVLITVITKTSRARRVRCMRGGHNDFMRPTERRERGQPHGRAVSTGLTAAVQAWQAFRYENLHDNLYYISRES